ncbi:MAG: type II secretion system F family protein [Candidatus Kerfeldbacteria bacterium]|nr:type II secretion system F family protein [Candidatus Kerfeldbacteria bacterium]
MALTYFPERHSIDETPTPLAPVPPPPKPQRQDFGTNREGSQPTVKKSGGLFGRISLMERTVFTQNLYVMTRGGIPLAQALATLRIQTKNKRFKTILGVLQQQIERGQSFSKALSLFPRYFSEVYVSMIAAGESSGKLESVLQELAVQLKKQRVLIGKIRGALFYPAIVLIAMVAMGIVMFVFVIPKITDIYKETGAVLPLPTRMLIGISTFVLGNGILVLLALLVLGVALGRYLRTTSGKKLSHGLLLRLPVFGTIIKKINLARFARTLHSLLQTDIPIVQSFQIIERTLGNIHYRMAMSEASQLLKKGISVVEALQKRPALFPPMVAQMLAVGEQSGTLDELANEIANFYEEDVDETMTNFSSIIEPVLLLLLGIGVAGMALAILLPMYSLTNQI